MKIPDKVKESELYKLLTYDITMQDRVSPARYARMQTQRAYKFVSDWAGLASNKIIFGMYMDSQVGMLPGTSLLARGFSLGAHTATSPLYTWAREFIYKKGNITPDRNIVMRQGAELLAFNAVQTPLYVAQISAAMAIRAYLDPAVEFEPMKVATGAFKFFQNSWWLAPAGKYSMDIFRRFFGAKTPEELAQDLETIVDE